MILYQSLLGSLILMVPPLLGQVSSPGSESKETPVGRCLDENTEVNLSILPRVLRRIHGAGFWSSCRPARPANQENSTCA